VTLSTVPAALAQTIEPVTLTADIPAQPLTQALAAFARQTGLQLVYVSGVVRDQKSHAVPAGLAAGTALARLLQGTGLKFEYLTPSSVRILAAAPTPEPRTQAPPGNEPYEVIISANRLEETFQNVPITIQTLTGDQLKQLGVSTLDDLLKYTPNVTYSGNGPGTGNIFIRGLGFVGTGNQTLSTTAPFPNVALYLDDQTMQFPARNNDVYLVDMARVEVLEGPQGTLLGGGAQAGAIRYITNKPDLNATTGEFNAGYGVTAHGDPNNTLNAVLNVPLVPGTFALRAVIFSDHQGGYIDNVPGTIGYPPGSVPATLGGNPTANNASLVGRNTNPVDYGGARLEASWSINDNWNLLLEQNYQDMEADGYFYAYPFASDGAALGPYEITAFTPAHNRDRYESTSWTVNGNVADLSVVYTGSYMVRHIDGQQDYSNYIRSVRGAYYGCIGPGASYFNSTLFPPLASKKLQCYAPVGNWQDIVSNQHLSHELRVSTPTDSRVRGLFGAYWEKFNIDDEMNFNYLAIPQCSPQNLAVALSGGADCLSAVGPVPGAYAGAPQLRTGTGTAFGEDDQRGYKQTALFASIDFDIIPKTLTITGGTRWYSYEEYEEGSEFYTESTSSGYVLDHANGVCTEQGLCGVPINLRKSESGFASRANLTWHMTPDIMAYYTFSQGFRPGGFNRVFSLPDQAPHLPANAPYCGAASTDPRCQPGGNLFKANTDQYLRPAGYESDHLSNNELGLKSELLSDRLLLNVAAYDMKWRDVQSMFFDPEHFGNGVFMTNGPSYTIKGAELQLIARLTEGLILQGSSSWNTTTLTNTPCLISAGVTPRTPSNPTPGGQCITVVGGLPYQTPWGALGTSAPFAPPLMFNLRVRYDWSIGASRPFAMVSASHIASMSNAPASFPDGNGPAENPPTTTLLRYTIPAYTTYDGALGVARDNWTAQLTGSNLTNRYAATNISSGQFIRSEIPLRPRVVMVQLGYRF
jgi:iron complex outermembrane recepter protein